MQRRIARLLSGAILLLSIDIAHGAGRWLGEPLHIQGGDGSARFRVEVAANDRRRGLGLMYRRKLDADRGMLFLWSNSAPRHMWMKNTRISLDMLFIDEHGEIIHIERQTEPLTLKVHSAPRPARAVLELLGGTAERHGLRAGDRVCHRALPSCPETEARESNAR